MFCLRSHSQLPRRSGSDPRGKEGGSRAPARRVAVRGADGGSCVLRCDSTTPAGGTAGAVAGGLARDARVPRWPDHRQRPLSRLQGGRGRRSIVAEGSVVPHLACLPAGSQASVVEVALWPACQAASSKRQPQPQQVDRDLPSRSGHERQQCITPCSLQRHQILSNSTTS